MFFFPGNYCGHQHLLLLLYVHFPVLPNCNEMFIAPWVREANWQSRSRSKPAEILTSFHYHHAYAFLPTFYPGYFLALLSELLDTPQSYNLWDILKSFPRIQEVYSILRAQGKKNSLLSLLAFLLNWETAIWRFILIIYLKIQI